MLITKRKLKKIIQESVSLIKEPQKAPCPISVANQLHAAGYSQEEVHQFVNSLLDQYQTSNQRTSEPYRGEQNYTKSPNRGGIIGGFGFGGF